MNEAAITLGGLLCPACFVIAYIMLIVAYRQPDAQFRNPWYDEEEDDDNENP